MRVEMKLYTAQLGRWREAEKRGINFLDVTVKSGDKMFAPTWDFLMRHKRDQDDDAYIAEFIPLMRENFKNNKEYWFGLLSQQEELAIACYCGKGKFCHRILLVDIFEKLCDYYNIEFEYMGEL
jgi:hypothetical protein